MSFGERAALEGVLRQLQPRLALEIGTYDGGNLRAIAAHSAHVHTFDLNDVVPDRKRFTNVTFHVGDPKTLVPSLLGELEQEGSVVDFILIDADHSTEGVRQDLEYVLASNATRRTVIVLHDTANDETRAGIERVDLARRDHVVYVELDFIAGHQFRGGHFDGQVWGGLGLIVTGDTRATAYRESPRQRRYVEPFAERQACADCRYELEATRADLQRHRDALGAMRSSASWRVTAPLRTAKARLRNRGEGSGLVVEDARHRLRAAIRAARSARHRPPPTPPSAEAPPTALPDHLRRDYEDNLNMRRLVAFVLREDDNAIDVGANEGGLLQEICRVSPNGQHVAFEPLPHLSDRLRERFPQVEVRSAAASNHFGTSTFAHVRAAEGWSGLKFRPLPGDQEPDLQEITVTLEPIDEVTDPDLGPALVKIDVEGAEQQVIEGAMRTLRTHSPIVLFEHGLGSANEFGTEPDDIWRLLVDEAGMRLFDLDGDGPYGLERFRRTYYEATRVNFVAHR